MAALTRDMIFKASDRPMKEVEVPEWGGLVFIRTLSGKERDQYVTEVSTRKRGTSINTQGLTAKLLMLALCDSEGKPLFTAGDEAQIESKSAAVLERLTKEIIKHNGMDEDAKAEAVKN